LARGLKLKLRWCGLGVDFTAVASVIVGTICVLEAGVCSRIEGALNCTWLSSETSSKNYSSSLSSLYVLNVDSYCYAFDIAGTS